MECTRNVCVWSKNTSGIQLALVSGLEVVLDKKKDTSGSKKKKVHWTPSKLTLVFAVFFLLGFFLLLLRGPFFFVFPGRLLGGFLLFLFRGSFRFLLFLFLFLRLWRGFSCSLFLLLVFLLFLLLLVFLVLEFLHFFWKGFAVLRFHVKKCFFVQVVDVALLNVNEGTTFDERPTFDFFKLGFGLRLRVKRGGRENRVHLFRLLVDLLCCWRFPLSSLLEVVDIVSSPFLVNTGNPPVR